MSFFDETVLDRSTLESAANCPMGARLTMDHKLHAGHLAAAGEEYHQCVSKAITDYLASADRGDNLRPGDVADLITDYAARSRPDVQQDVLTTAARSAYAVGTIIAETAPPNILRYDGGQGDRSGQLAVEFPGFLATSELDFLRATDSPDVLDVIDWKSGWKPWTFAAVKASFQFQMHALLVLANYDVEQVRIRVYLPKYGRLTAAVCFTRRDLDQIRARINSAGEIWLSNQDAPIADVPAWPSRDKCRICDACQLCQIANQQDKTDPVDMLEYRIVLAQQLKDTDDRLWAHVDHTGEDIRLEDGTSFGYDKPSVQRKSSAPVYDVVHDTDDGDEGEGA